jgi:CheY-like chemotaxis protein
MDSLQPCGYSRTTVSARLYPLSPTDNPLLGLKVLVVEDEGIVALWLQGLLEDLGCTVLGPAMRVADALALLEVASPEAAILDVNIKGELVYPVADKLLQLGIPFLFTTGYSAAGLIEAHRAGKVLRKPYLKDTLRKALEELVSPGADNEVGRQ